MKRKYNHKDIMVLVGVIVLFIFLALGVCVKKKEKLKANKYCEKFLQKENRKFPFRYFQDISGNALPFVAVTGPFREAQAEVLYYEYLANGIYIFGITAYKTFPNRLRFGMEEGEYERKDTFDYVGKIKHWLCCFRDKESYGFTSFNKTLDISESDFYTEEKDLTTVKKYDFLYICNKDEGDACPLNGWNAINRNYELALKCFPIMCNELNLKGLIVGRVGCGLEEVYSSENMEISDWLDWGSLQEKMKECKILFVPNIYDASPRVVAECLTKGVAVVMNKNILCGSKYIHYETGELFTDETDVKHAMQSVLERIDTISPNTWWSENFDQEQSYEKLHAFLNGAFPKTVLDSLTKVRFIL